MGKKNKNTYFNLFNVESDMDSQEEISAVKENENQSQDNKSYFSITNFDLDNYMEKEADEKGQLSMFENEEFEVVVNNTIKEDSDKVFIAQTVEDDEIPVIENETEETDILIDEDLEQNEFALEEISQEILVDTEETEEFFVEPIKKSEMAEDNEEDAEKIIEEEILVSNLETNALDEEYTQSQEETNNTPNIFDNIPEYKTIKNQATMDGFETAYVYHGKSGDRIRYRLSLPTDNDPKRNRRKKFIAGWALTIIVALILAFLIRTFVFVVATVDGPSMQPTLTNNDRLIVTKYDYYFADVKRGDIVICRFNDPNYPDIYVKRVIGLPGEMISIIDGVVYINGTAISEDYTEKSLPGIDRHYNMDAYYIPEGHVFVMGDNRNNSADSRMHSNGAISVDLIIGKAQWRIFPFNNMGSLEESN